MSLRLARVWASVAVTPWLLVPGAVLSACRVGAGGVVGPAPEPTVELGLLADPSNDPFWRVARFRPADVAGSTLHAFIVADDLSSSYHEIPHSLDDVEYGLFLGHVRQSRRYDIWLAAFEQGRSSTTIARRWANQPIGVGPSPDPSASEMGVSLRVLGERLDRAGSELNLEYEVLMRGSPVSGFAEWGGSAVHAWAVSSDRQSLAIGHTHIQPTGRASSRFHLAAPGGYVIFLQPLILGLGKPPPVLRHAVSVNSPSTATGRVPMGRDPFRTNVVLGRTVLASMPLFAGRMDEGRGAPLVPRASAGTDLVFFTEDTALPPRQGCDGISVFDVTSGIPLHLGVQMPSPGRLAGTSDLQLVVAGRTNGIDIWPACCPLCCWDLYVLRWTGSAWQETYLQTSRPVTPVGGIAITPDGRYLLVATQGSLRQDMPCTGSDYGVSKYALSEIDWLNHTTGPERGRVETDNPVAEIVFTDSGRTGHAVAVAMRTGAVPVVVSFDVARMQQAGQNIEIRPTARFPVNCDTRAGYENALAATHADVSPDDRYLVTNRRGVGQINVVDLRQRQSWTLQTPGLETTGGLAFSKASPTRGLLAVHGLTKVVVYGWHTGRSLDSLSWRQVEAPGLGSAYDWIGYLAGPTCALAWSASGEWVIAAASQSGPFEFRAWQVDPSGQLFNTVVFEACGWRPGNLANDILTGRGLPPLVTPTAAPSETPRLAVTATPPAPARTTEPAEATATGTGTPTWSATAYLPLVANSVCLSRDGEACPE